MTYESFVRWYRVAVLGGALGWRLVLFNPFRARGVYDAIEGIVYGVGLGMLPAAALALIAGYARQRWIFVAAATMAFTIEVAVYGAATLRNSASTAVVASMFSPLLATGTVVPITALLSRLLRDRSKST